MADNVYQINDIAPLEATFKNAAGVNTNPTTVTLTVRAPDGTISTPTPTNPSTGVYHYDLPVTQPGLWWYTFKGTGTVTAADRNSFVAEADWITTAGPLSTRALVTLDQAREYVLGDVTDDTQDAKLIRRINAFSAAVWAYTAREWKTATAATRKFSYPGYGTLRLAPYDLRTVTSITIQTDWPTLDQTVLAAGTPTVAGDYRLLPFGGDPLTGTFRWVDLGYTLPYPLIADTYDGWPFDRLPRRGYEITIVGDWGIPTVPDDVKEAVLLAIDNATKNPEGGASRTFGELTVTEPLDATLADSIWRALPAESRALLTPYRDDVGAIVA